MKSDVVFVGVGEAFDETLPNTSLLLRTPSSRILLDCGFTAAHAYWRAADNPLDLDAVWISHFHGDHFFGLPLLLLRFAEEGRRAALTVAGGEGVEERVRACFDLAFSGFWPRIGFEIRFVPFAVGEAKEAHGLIWRTALNGHSAPCLALRLEGEHGSFFYSGDGGPTEESSVLCRGVDLLVHEAYALEHGSAGHSSVRECIELAKCCAAHRLAVVHVQRRERRKKRDGILNMLSGSGIDAFMPEPGECVVLR